MTPPKVISRTENTGDGIVFSVLRDGVNVWSVKVLFGHAKRFRAGGAAFVETALEQVKIAKREREEPT